MLQPGRETGSWCLIRGNTPEPVLSPIHANGHATDDVG